MGRHHERIGLSLLVLLLALSACGGAPRVPPRLEAGAAPTAAPAVRVVVPEGDPADLLEGAVGTPFTLTLGEQIAIGDTGLTLAFSAVAEDSRCPEGARCLWQGRAVVTIEALAAGQEIQALTLAIPGDVTPDAPEAQALGPYTLRLLNLTPYPGAPGADREPYVVELVLEARK